jgi:acetolactate synthase-1/2/3 large subunit
LREYQREAGFEHFGVDLVQPDFYALCMSFDLPARRTTPHDLETDLAWSLAEPGPAVVLLETVLAMPRPTP